MKKNGFLKKFILPVSLIVSVSFLLSGCGQPAASDSAGSGSSIKVGIIDTYTGPPTAYTQDALDGFKLALEEVSKQGGPKIEYVTRDDEFKVDKALSWAKQLVMQEKVDVLAGTINSGASLAVSEYAKENKTPFFVWGGMSDKISGAQGNHYVFSMLPNTAMIGKAGAVQMAKMPYTKFWLAGSDYEYGHSVVDNFWANLKKLKPEVEKIGDSWWKPGEADFTPYITAIRSAKPQAIIVGAGGADMVPFMKALKATGLANDIPVWVHTATDEGTLRALGADGAPSGVLGTNAYFSYFPETPENKAFVEEFEKAYKRKPAAFALNGYITGKFLAEAVKKAGNDKDKLVSALEGMTLDNTPVGKATIRKEDHQVMVPMFYGKTGKDSSGSEMIAHDIVTIPADQIMPSVEEIMSQRAKK